MSLKDLLGGKGANLAEMTSVLELPVPPGFTITTDACRAYMDGGWPDEPRRRDRQGRHQGREADGQGARRPRRPAAGERPLGRQVLDARDDGHRPQPRAQRRVGRGPRQADRRRALRLRLLPPLHRHVRAHRARHRRRALRPPARDRQGVGRRHRRRRHLRRDAAAPVRALQGRRQAGDGQALPAGPDQAAQGRHRGRVPVVERRPRHRLPRARAHPARPRHRRQRADHGVRQPRRQLRHRRRLHPQRRHRRERRPTATSS